MGGVGFTVPWMTDDDERVGYGFDLSSWRWVFSGRLFGLLSTDRLIPEGCTFRFVHASYSKLCAKRLVLQTHPARPLNTHSSIDAWLV
jgi:hypothetical protein